VALTLILTSACERPLAPLEEIRQATAPGSISFDGEGELHHSGNPVYGVPQVYTIRMERVSEGNLVIRESFGVWSVRAESPEPGTYELAPPTFEGKPRQGARRATGSRSRANGARRSSRPPERW
jgi:hypothetical protein